MPQTSKSNSSVASGKVSSRPIRIGLVAGPETLRNLGPVVRHLIVGLLDEPLPVVLICPAEADIENVPVPPVEVIRYRISRLPFLRGRSLEALSRQVGGAGPSLLHALDAGAADLTDHLAAMADVDYVVGSYSLRDGMRSFKGRSADGGARRLGGGLHCRAILAAGEPIRESLLGSPHVGVRGPAAGEAGMIRLLRPGVHQAGRATCFINPTHAAAIVAAGQLRNYRPFAAALESFAKLQAAKLDCVFFLVGNGPCETRLRRKAERLGLMRDLTFVDRQSPEQLGGILRAADIFISPAASERLEIELLSAMAAGVPVLAAGAEASDFIIPDETALTFPTGNAGELTAKLAALIGDHAAAKNLAENALAHLRENHSPAKMVGQLVSIYREIAGKKRHVD